MEHGGFFQAQPPPAIITNQPDPSDVTFPDAFAQYLANPLAPGDSLSSLSDAGSAFHPFVDGQPPDLHLPGEFTPFSTPPPSPSKRSHNHQQPEDQSIASLLLCHESLNSDQQLTPRTKRRARADRLTVEDVEWKNQDGKWHGACPDCKKWINTGSMMNPNLGPIRSHMKGERSCKPSPADEAEVHRARQTRDALFPRQPTPPPGTPRRIRQSTVTVETPTLPSRSESSEENTRSNLPASSLSDAPSECTCSHQNAICPACDLDWPEDDFFSTYPFQRHGHTSKSLGFKFASVDKDGKRFRVRSDFCTMKPSPDGGPCHNCRAVRGKIEHLAELARHAAPRTNYIYRSHKQLREALHRCEETIREWKLKAMTLVRNYGSVLNRLSDHHRLVMAAAEADVPRFQQIIRQALKAKSSVSSIIHRIEESLTGLYHARGYTEEDKDISLLVLRLGGRKLLYALNQHIAIPSLRALRRNMAVSRLLPSLGHPRKEDIMFNIRSVLQSRQPPPDQPLRTGVTIAWDEISMEETAAWFPHADAVGGFCREHSDSVNTRLSTFEHAVSIARALFDGTMHYGREASVIAIGTFSSRFRSMLPIVVSPTCKTETPEASGHLLTEVINAYNEVGAAILGPIWSFASDGDAGRRKMVHQLFFKRTVDVTHRLYRYLGRLPGLNLQVGDGDITCDFDWKHELKRIGRLLRSLEGITVNKTIINFETLRRHLYRTGLHTETEVDRLMNPADSQDVPRAIDFIEAVEAVGQHTDGCNPSQLEEAKVIGTVGEIYAAFMDAFICPDWSLTDQVTSLSKFAHAAFALYRRHRTAFMPSQLYGDMQNTVKNIFFCLAKQQDLDATQPLYLFWTGDDRLELLFGRVRMLGGHNPNFSFKQLLDRLIAALDLDGIFTRHPSWDMGFRRLKVDRSEHADHLNPESWRGVAVANTVDLESAWLNGRQQAIELLKHLDISVDFDALFDKGRQLDMLKPFGDGVFPGVSDEPDRSLEAFVPAAQSSSEEAVPASGNQNTEPIEHSLLDDSDATAPTVLHPSDREITSLSSACISITSEEESTMGSESLDDPRFDLDLEDVLEDDDRDQLPLAPGVPTTVSPWILVEGRKVHKASICRLVITPDYIRKSHERLRRIRCYTEDGSRPTNLNFTGVTEEDAFINGDLFATLVCCEDKVCLAVLKSIVIEEKANRVSHVRRHDLPHPAAGIRLAGQILAIEPARLRSHPLSDDPISGPDDMQATKLGRELERDRTWLWKGTYAQFALPSKGANTSTAKATRKTLIVKVPGYLCEPISARIADARQYLPAFGTGHQSSQVDLTWEWHEGELELLTTRLWETLRQHDAQHTIAVSLPSLAMNDDFPYRLCDDVMFMSQEASQWLQVTQKSSNQFRCYQCLAEMRPTMARAHVGGHILKAMRDIDEALIGGPVGASNPCGFCGRSGIRTCSELFLSVGKHPQVRSECQHAHTFKYGSSKTSTVTTPCTNTPIVCPIEPCNALINKKWQRAIWKYNMPEHIRTCHPGYSPDGVEDGASLPAALLEAMEITVSEEQRLGIPFDKIPLKPKITQQVPQLGSEGDSSRRPKRLAEIPLDVVAKLKTKRTRTK